MSAIHPKGTRLAAQRARVVSGKTKTLRPSFGLAGQPAQSTHTIGGVKTGISGATLAKRANAVAATPTGKSGKTIAARTPIVNTSPPVVNSSTGDLHDTGTTVMSDSPVGEGKSGATLFQRNLTNFQLKIFETVLVVGLIVGGIYVVKHFKLLQGGR